MWREGQGGWRTETDERSRARCEVWNPHHIVRSVRLWASDCNTDIECAMGFAAACRQLTAPGQQFCLGCVN
jgi:hypothetical protein